MYFRVIGENRKIILEKTEKKIKIWDFRLSMIGLINLDFLKLVDNRFPQEYRYNNRINILLNPKNKGIELKDKRI